MGSFEEGSPDYAELNNAEIIQGVDVEYHAHAATFADSTNDFVPYYRQYVLRHAGELQLQIMMIPPDGFPDQKTFRGLFLE